MALKLIILVYNFQPGVNLLFFEKNWSNVSITPIEWKKEYWNIALNRYDFSSIHVFKRMFGIPPVPLLYGY